MQPIGAFRVILYRTILIIIIYVYCFVILVTITIPSKITQMDFAMFSHSQPEPTEI